MLNLELSAQASNDIASAISYYEAISPQLADAFIYQLGHSTNIVLRHAAIGSLRFAPFFRVPDVRVWSLDRFPYRLVYLVDGTLLRVLRVSHIRSVIGPDSLQLA